MERSSYIQSKGSIASTKKQKRITDKRKKEGWETGKISVAQAICQTNRRYRRRVTIDLGVSLKSKERCKILSRDCIRIEIFEQTLLRENRRNLLIK